MKRTLALFLAALMAVSVLVGCSKTTENESSTSQESNSVTVTGTYTYTDAVSTLTSNWNPHTYQTNDDSYLSDFIRVGLYSFIFNDELNPVDGEEAYDGYVIIPDMAADFPVDVTEQVKAEHPEYGIPSSATAGYAYTIDLNQSATWEDGTPIDADTYVESMKRLLNPDLLNYRATDYYTGSIVIAGAEAYANQGHSSFTALGMSVAEYLAAGGNLDDLYIDIDGFWGVTTDDGTTYVSINDDTMYRDPAVEEGEDEDYVSGKYIWDTYLSDDAPYSAYQSEYVGTATSYPSGVDFDTVGIYKSGDYQITLVFAKSLAGFNLLYNLSSNWIVKTDLYDSCLTESNGVWTSTYNTSVETTSSYGPYRLDSYQSSKALHLTRNENWYGYTDGKHVYVDPTDGKTYDMYMTTDIDCQVVEESATQKMMFLKGQLMTYALQSDDYATYRNSEYCYSTPGDTTFFFIMNGYMQAIQNREAADDFDQTTTDIETITLMSFRKALAVTYDRELFAATVSPARSGAYGLLASTLIYDPDTGATYRSTDQAKQALCDFYSVDVTQYATLDDAVNSITGYDPEKARELYTEAFNEAIELGYITDTDGDGISDQTIYITYSMSADSDFMTKTIDYLNEKMNEVTAGTPFEGKIQFSKSAPYGTDWANKLKAGLADTALAGWTGSKLDPFSLTDVYANANYQYDANWFNASAVSMTLTVPVNGVDTEVTMNLKQWSDCLNGTTVTVNGTEYNFGEGIVETDTRLSILAGFENVILQTYDYIPMLQDGSMSLLSQKAYYVVEDYNPILGRGGIQYLKYNYNDADWDAYVTAQGGELQY